MSILATNMGFSAAMTNPFTIGVAQKLAGLPLFSGSALRVLIFLAIYAVPAISDYSLPIVGILFLAAGLGAGLLSGADGKRSGSRRVRVLGIALAIHFSPF